MDDKERNGEYMDNSGNEFIADVMLPCPFCGSEPDITFKGNNHTKKRSVTIKCPKCRIQRTDAALRNNHEWCAKVCIEQWNARHGA